MQEDVTMYFLYYVLLIVFKTFLSVLFVIYVYSIQNLAWTECVTIYGRHVFETLYISGLVTFYAFTTHYYINEEYNVTASLIKYLFICSHG